MSRTPRARYMSALDIVGQSPWYKLSTIHYLPFAFPSTRIYAISAGAQEKKPVSTDSQPDSHSPSCPVLYSQG